MHSWRRRRRSSAPVRIVLERRHLSMKLMPAPQPRRLIAEAGVLPCITENFWLASTCRHAIHAPELSLKRAGFETFCHRFG